MHKSAACGAQVGCLSVDVENAPTRYFTVSSYQERSRSIRDAQSWSPPAMLTAIRILQRYCGKSRPPARCCATDPYSPDSFLGEFLFRVERSNFAEAGG
jgi:hypothetical protein